MSYIFKQKRNHMKTIVTLIATLAAGVAFAQSPAPKADVKPAAPAKKEEAKPAAKPASAAKPATKSDAPAAQAPAKAAEPAKK
jgi:hypothetical protein